MNLQSKDLSVLRTSTVTDGKITFSYVINKSTKLSLYHYNHTKNIYSKGNLI